MADCSMDKGEDWLESCHVGRSKRSLVRYPPETVDLMQRVGSHMKAFLETWLRDMDEGSCTGHISVLEVLPKLSAGRFPRREDSKSAPISVLRQSENAQGK